MNLRRAYILLAVFHSLLVLIGLVALLRGAGSPLALAQVGVGALAVVGLWGHVLDKGVLGPRLWRPLAGLLVAAAVVQLLMALTTPLSGNPLTWLLGSAIFFMMLGPLLYRYGDRDQDLWASPEELAAGRRLAELLGAHARLHGERHEAGRRTSVRLTRAGDEYRASVERQRPEATERFEARFRRPATLAFFLEKFTCLTADDFAAGDDTLARDAAVRNDDRAAAG